MRKILMKFSKARRWKIIGIIIITIIIKKKLSNFKL